MVEVLFAACRLETVDRRKDVVEYAGLETRVVDIEVFCLERAYPLIAGQLSNRDAVETVAIVDIGANMTTLSVLDKGKSITPANSFWWQTAHSRNCSALWFKRRRCSPRQSRRRLAR